MTPTVAEPRVAPAHRPRVLFAITSSGFGGAERILQNVALGLDRERFEPMLCSLRARGAMADALERSGLTVRSLGASDAARLGDLATSARGLARLVDELEVDLIHAFLYRANVVARLSARLSKRRPVVVSGHHSLTPPPSGRLGIWAERLTHRLSDRCLAVSQAVRRHLIVDDHAPEAIVEVIDNGVDCRHFSPTADGGARLRDELGLGPDSFVLGGAGRLAPVKAFDHLIDALAAVRTAGIPATLLLAGSGDERASLERHAHERGVGEHVRFLGLVADLRAFYAALDAFVLSSREEASPTVVLEAMASGRAVVATRCGGSLEMVVDGQSGLFVDAGRPDQLADAIARLARDRGLCRQLASGGRTRALDRFDSSRMVERHAQLYTTLLSMKP